MHSMEVSYSEQIYTLVSGAEVLLLGILAGVCCPVPQILTLIQTKKRPFLTHTNFHTWHRQKLCHHYLD